MIKPPHTLLVSLTRVMMFDIIKKMNIGVVVMDTKYLAIAFDDGPRSPMYEMIDKFTEYGWKAGFAIVGENINDNTEAMLRYAVDRGFQLVCHSQTHAHLEHLETIDEIRAELVTPINEVQKRLNYTITMARLPFLTFNDDVLKVTRELNLPLLDQGINGGSDWNQAVSPQDIAKAVLGSVRDGAIATLHVNPNTCDALDIIFPELKERGYKLVTPAELFELKGIKDIPLGIGIKNVNSLLK